MNSMVEWEVTLKCNYKCDYCGLLRPIKEITDEVILKNFITDLNKKYPDTEIFLFGGEPFLHPKIEFIIQQFQELNQPFVIQSNLSNKSTEVIKTLKVEPFKLNISVHVSQTTLQDIIKNVNLVKPTEIHLMYTEDNGKVEDYYRKINLIKGNSKLILTPVSNLGCTGYEDVLEKYNSIKYNYVYDSNKILYKGEQYLRSDLWSLQNNSSESLTKGKPCQYLNQYVLFTPDLKEMNCCYRKNHNGICHEQNCFFM